MIKRMVLFGICFVLLVGFFGNYSAVAVTSREEHDVELLCVMRAEQSFNRWCDRHRNQILAGRNR